MHKLKDHSNHLAAFIYSQKKTCSRKNPNGLMPDLVYVAKLMSLEPGAVKIMLGKDIFPDDETQHEYDFCSFLYPYEAGLLEPDEIPGETVLSWEILRIYQFWHVHSKARAAKYCGVTIRQLERWMKDGLPFYKHGRERLFYERDLWDYMTENAVGERIKNQGNYIEGQAF